jgi:hypothetical protein
LSLLTEADIEVIERAVIARKMGELSGWGWDDQFTFEINVSETVDDPIEGDILGENPNTPLFGGDPLDDPGFILDPNLTDPAIGRPQEKFPEDPFRLQENVRLVLRALKPAHTLYDYRHLFREYFGEMFTGSMSWSMDLYYYEDQRRFCLGAQRVTGDAGETLTDRSLFVDPTRDFSSISPGAELLILTGPNSIVASTTDPGYVGRYQVAEVRAFPVGDDTTSRSYTTSGGLTGSATVSGDVIEDVTGDFASVSEGETLTFSEGPNAGTYRLSYLLGIGGGRIGYTTFPSGQVFTRVRVSPSVLRIEERMPEATTGQSYEVGVDRLGVQVPREVTGEDASVYFLQ